MAVPSFETFVPGGEAGIQDSAPSYWFILRGSDLLIARDGTAIDLPFTPDTACLGFSSERAHLVGSIGTTPCRALGVPAEANAPAGWVFAGVRSLFGTISERFFAVAARALEISEWDRTHRFCGSCGSPTALKPGERALQCTACGHLSYPRISPAVIVAVIRGARILLARARRFPPGMYSVLAGFVEPGETLEECVAREVREETGIEVRSLRYFASQPWPFPHSLMVAFTAEHASGEISVDPVEIVDAGWYSADSLPQLPDPITVARKLIDWFASGAGPGRSQ
ncbi:MAG: NAD(+) diphosphatase [Spirochaetia bacterium]